MRLGTIRESASRPTRLFRLDKEGLTTVGPSCGCGACTSFKGQDGESGRLPTSIDTYVLCTDRVSQPWKASMCIFLDSRYGVLPEVLPT